MLRENERENLFVRKNEEDIANMRIHVSYVFFNLIKNIREMAILF